jgi:hypothetical protein
MILSKNESSFITIIKNMWNIHEDVTEDMFPSFVDKESMTYLTEVEYYPHYLAKNN